MKKLISAYGVSEVYVAGMTEDGHEFTAEVFYVVAEYSNGERIRHQNSFRGCRKTVDPDGYPVFEDIRIQSGKAAKRLADRIDQSIKDGLALNMDYWYETRPVYGSAAFSNADEVEIERQERDQQNN